MARKKKPEEHENHERWLVSYADFITLLFAFFVVMYSLSSVNEGKYRVLSDSLVSAFEDAPKSLRPVQIGDPIKELPSIFPDSRPQLKTVPEVEPEAAQEKRLQQEGQAGQRDRQNLNKLQKQLENSLGPMIERDLISVKRTGKGLEVEINSSILFDSGKALIQAKAVSVLTGIAASIKSFPNAVQVEGYTDNIPIETFAYPSNWELSAGRASSVVHLFSDEGVDPFRMSAIGYGEFRPVALNTTVEGRERNRRVVVVIMSEAAAKLYDNEQVIEITPASKRLQNIDLDEPPSLIEVPIMTSTVPVPEQGFPEGLPLRGRGGSSGNADEQDRLMTIMEVVDEAADTQGEAP